jgi:hypothetical protein
MIAPTERSMPAVRMTSVCAAPTMPTMATCWMMSVSVKALKNLPPTRIPKIATDSDEDDQRHGRLVRMQRVLRLLQKRSGRPRKDATVLSLLSRTFSNSCACAIPHFPQRRFFVFYLL